MTAPSHPTISMSQGPRGPELVIQGRHAHSKYDPSKEAQRLISTVLTPDTSTLVIFGPGLGHTIQAALTWASTQQVDLTIIVIDPLPPPEHPEIYDYPLLKSVLQAPRVFWVSSHNPTGLDELLSRVHPRHLTKLANPAYQAAWPEVWEAVEETITKIQFRRQVNSNTLEKFGKLWARNLLRNLRAFIEAPGVQLSQGTMKGLPVLLLAGGPSLDDIIPILPKLRQKFCICAVETALKACVQGGIEPDFVVTVDPQYWNSLHLDCYHGSTSILVGEPSVCPRSLRTHPGRYLAMSSLFPLGQFIEERYGHKGTLGAGGSVATSAWDFCRQLQPSHLVMAGLDLSYPGGKTHFHGSFFEENLHKSSNRTQPAQTGAWRYLVDGSAIRVPTDLGTTLPSDQRMNMYAQWFETQKALYPNFSCTRLQADNRSLTGFPRTSLETILAYPDQRPTIDATMGELKITMEAWKAQQETSSYQGFLNLLHDKITQLAKLSREAARLCKSMKPGSADPSITRKLDKLDQRLLARDDTRILGFLMEDILKEIDSEPAPKTFDQAMERSLRLYQGLQDAAAYYEAIVVKIQGQAADN